MMFYFLASPYPVQALDCSKYVALNCGDEYTGNTVSWNSMANAWCFMEALRWPGNEVVFWVELKTKGDIFLEIVSGWDKLDVFLVDECLKEPCIDWGDISCGGTGLPAGIYYFVLDGDAGNIDFQVRLTCNTVPVLGNKQFLLLLGTVTLMLLTSFLQILSKKIL